MNERDRITYLIIMAFTCGCLLSALISAVRSNTIASDMYSRAYIERIVGELNQRIEVLEKGR